MPPKGAMKRPASAAPIGRPPKKSPAEAAMADKCKAIGEAVKASDLPDHIAQALAAAVGSCMKTYKAERHPFQNQMLEMIGETLTNSKVAQKSALENAQAKISGFDAAKEARQEELAGAEKLAAEAAEMVSERKAVHVTAAEALKKAVADRKASAAAQKNSEKVLEELAAKKSKLETAFSAEGFGALKEKPGSASAVKQFTKACQECGFDKSLLDSVPPVLTSSPENRGTFGALIVEQLESQYNKALTDLSNSQGETETAKSEHAQAMESSDLVLKTAQEKDEESKKSLEEAVAQQSQTAKKVSEIKKAIQGALPELEQAKRDVAAATDALNKLEGGALAYFAELLEHSPPPEPVEEPAVEASDSAEGKKDEASETA